MSMPPRVLEVDARASSPEGGVFSSSDAFEMEVALLLAPFYPPDPFPGVTSLRLRQWLSQYNPRFPEVGP